MSEEFYYAKVIKPMGSSRFSIEMLDGSQVESTLKGELRNKKKKSNTVNPYDWVKVQKTDISISGTFYKIIERIGNDKDKEVKSLKKLGLLDRTETEIETIKIEQNEIKNKIEYEGKQIEEIQEQDDSWIDAI